jgi:ribonuclease Z
LFEIQLLGTGCPQCDPDRRGPSNLVRVQDRNFLVDCGSGVTQRLVEAGTPGKSIDALFLTHLHSDHLVDFYQWVISSWHQGRDRPQRVIGPLGTRAFVTGTMDLWAGERAQRIAHERRPSIEGLTIDITEIDPALTNGIVYQEDGVTVRAVAVAHQPVKHAYGFVFESGGRKAVFSGDTAYCPALIEAARGADALVHECFIHREMKVAPGVRSAEVVAAVASYHTLPAEAGRVAAEADVGLLILNHFVPTRFDRSVLLAEVRESWKGPLVIGEDLMRFDLEARSIAHRDGLIGF